MYTDFARVYDTLMRGVPYAAWAEHYLRLLRLCGVDKGAKIVECACGTGNLTVPLAKAGLSVVGIDLSGDMLAVAMQKSRAAGLNIPFVRMDMRALTTPRRVSAVLSTCDGVNYLTNEKQAKSFFDSAYQCLKDGGALIFDVSTPHKLLESPQNALIASGDADTPFIWRNSVHGDAVDMALTIFSRGDDGRYDRIEENQTQRAWRRDELKALLKQSGFADIGFYGNLRLSASRKTDDRWHITARKVIT